MLTFLLAYSNSCNESRQYALRRIEMPEVRFGSNHEESEWVRSPPMGKSFITGAREEMKPGDGPLTGCLIFLGIVVLMFLALLFAPASC